MRIKSLTTVLLIAVLSLVTFVSCSDNAGESSGGQTSILVNSSAQVFRDISGLKNFRANINSSTAAVGKQEGSVSRDASRSLDSYLNYLLVKVDEGQSQAEPVTFTANTNTKINGRTIHAGDVITQDKLTGSVDKVYVIGDYTLVSFLTVDALTLINSKDTSVQSNSYSTSYSGSLNFSSNDSNNGGTNENIWYYYDVPSSKLDEERFTIEYTYSKWWRDSSGRHNSEEIRIRDDLTLRCEANNVQAFNEYNGVAVYDTFDYYTSDFRSSFIIDNNTGLIYAIPYGKGDDRVNLSVYQGVVIDRNLGPVKLSINGSGELELEQILANPNIYIYDVFKDSNDQYYVRTDSLSETDGNVKFYNVCGEYLPTEDGRVIHVSYNNSGMVGSSEGVNQIAGLSFVDGNFMETPINSDDSILINYLTCFPYNDVDPRFFYVRGLFIYNEKNGFEWWQYNNNSNSGAKVKFLYVEDGVLYFQSIQGSQINTFEYTLETKDILLTSIGANYVDARCALLDDTYGLLAKKQHNNKYSLYFFNTSESSGYGNKFQIIYHFDGTSEEICNGDYDEVWKYAYENDMTMVFNSYYDSQLGRIVNASDYYCLGTQYYNLSINGEEQTLVFKEGFDYFRAREEYSNSLISETLILSDVSVYDWKGYWDAYSMTFNVISKNGTDTYKIAKNGKGSYKAVLASSSTVTTTTLTLQPINR